jgi:hypothetical protein
MLPSAEVPVLMPFFISLCHRRYEIIQPSIHFLVIKPPSDYCFRAPFTVLVTKRRYSVFYIKKALFNTKNPISPLNSYIAMSHSSRSPSPISVILSTTPCTTNANKISLKSTQKTVRPFKKACMISISSSISVGDDEEQEVDDDEESDGAMLSMYPLMYRFNIVLPYLLFFTERLSKGWCSAVYGFFKPDVKVGYEGKRKYHFFCCAAKKCKGQKGIHGVRRFQDLKDRVATSNLKSHAIKCFGQDAVDAAFNGCTQKLKIRQSLLHLHGKANNLSRFLSMHIPGLNLSEYNISHQDPLLN